MKTIHEQKYFNQTLNTDLLKVSTYQKNSLKAQTDWKRIHALTEEEMLRPVETSPDALPLSLDELKKFKRVHPIRFADVKKIRKTLHLTQKEFAEFFGAGPRTIQGWEQKRKNPSTIARNFLRVIEVAPTIVQKAL